MNENEPWSPNSSDNELWLLIARFCDGSASQEECALLEARLRGDAVAKAFYIRYARLHAALQLRSRREPLAIAALVREQLDAQRTSALGSSLLGNEPFAAPNAGMSFMLGSLRQSPVSSWRSPVIWSLLLVALLPVVIVGASAFAWQFGPRVANAADSVTLASLTRTLNCIWRTGNLPTYEGAQLSRGVLRLESGDAEVEFTSGAKAVLQGPVDFELTSDVRCFVHAGTVVVQVPQQASGFTVATPMATVVDLGAEFGVNVDEGRQLFVHCFQGQAQVEPNPGLAAAAATQVLVAGHSSTIARDGAAVSGPGPFDINRFVRALTPVPVLLTPDDEVSVVNVEFGPEGSDGYRGLGAIGLRRDDHWNMVSALGTTSSPLTDAARRPTGVTVMADAQLMHTTEFHRSGNTLHNDYCFVCDAGSTGRFVVRGLVPGEQYDLYLFGSTGICPRQPSDFEVSYGSPEGSVFTIGAESKATVGLRTPDKPFVHSRDYVTFERVAADAAGEIRGTWTNNPQANAPLNNNPFGPFNGLQIVGRFKTAKER